MPVEVSTAQGIMRILSRDELEGVMAHELAHVRNRDTLISTVAATIAGAISMLANMLQWGAIFGMGRSDEEGGGSVLGSLALAIIAPIAAMVVQMAVSRSREFLANMLEKYTPNYICVAFDKPEPTFRLLCYLFENILILVVIFTLFYLQNLYFLL